MSSAYLTRSLSSGKTPWWGVAWLLLQDGRSSRDGGGHRDSVLPSKTMPTSQAWGSLLGDRTASKKTQRLGVQPKMPVPLLWTGKWVGERGSVSVRWTRALETTECGHHPPLWGGGQSLTDCFRRRDSQTVF